MRLALILDDSPFLAQHLSSLLKSQGLDARIPVDAADLQALAPVADLIFIELQQFEANGFQVTRELAPQVSCPLVLVTGTGRNTDLQWALRAGASAVLQRPLTERNLGALLQLLKLVPQVASVTQLLASPRALPPRRPPERQQPRAGGDTT